LKKILLTGFEPFNKFKINPSQQVVEKLSKSEFEDGKLKTLILPVDTKRVWANFLDVVVDFNPDVILCTGLSAKRVKISLEKVAINLLDFDIVDNESNLVEDMRIIEESSTAYFSNLPLKSLKKILENEKIPAKISYSAGAFLCNQLFFLVMEYINKKDSRIFGGFLHLPPTPEMNLSTKYASRVMSFDMELKAVRLIIEYLLSDF